MTTLTTPTMGAPTMGAPTMGAPTMSAVAEQYKSAGYVTDIDIADTTEATYYRAQFDALEAKVGARESRHRAGRLALQGEVHLGTGDPPQDSGSD